MTAYADMEKPSSIFRRSPVGQLIFRCPGCGTTHAVAIGKGDGPRWSFNGDFERPTFSPSLLVTWAGIEKRCHSFVRDGQIQFLGDCSHGLAGQTVPIPDFDKAERGA